MSHTRLYQTWSNMKTRCTNPKSDTYKWYGAKGIKVCDRWLESFDNFYEDMKDTYKDNLTLDRINNKGNYCKENCRWATAVEQMQNTANNRYIIYKNKKMSVSQACKITGVKQNLFSMRVDKYGWSIEKALIPYDRKK